MPKKKSLGELVAVQKKTKISELSTDTQVIFGLLCLIVDIRYKNRYGKSLEWKEGRGYKMNINTEGYEAEQCKTL